MPGVRLSTLFRALGNPVRLVIVFRMLDGKPYTKEDLYGFVRNVYGETVTRNTIDRHIRILESYGVVKEYHRVRRKKRGRRPASYVLSSEAASFYRRLYSFLEELLVEGPGPHGPGTGSAGKGLARIMLQSLRRARLALYFSLLSSPDPGGAEALAGKASSLTGLMVLLGAQEAGYRVASCPEAKAVLRAIAGSRFLYSRVPRDRLAKVLLSTGASSPAGLGEALGLLGARSLEDGREKVESLGPPGVLGILVDKCPCGGPECGDLLVALANSLLEYLSRSTSRREDRLLLLLSLLT